MSATVAELIGQIINPSLPSSPQPAAQAGAALPAEPLHVLIGRIVHPPFGPAPETAQAPEVVEVAAVPAAA